MKKHIYVRFSLMMFFIYAIGGMGAGQIPYYLSETIAKGGLGFNALQVGLCTMVAGGIAALLAPFIAGQLSDRILGAERALALSMILGGIINIILSFQKEFWIFFPLILASTIFIVGPMMTITNSIIFRHLDDAKKQFGIIRVWGTIGFIAGMWIFPMLFLENNLHFSWKPPFIVGDEIEGVTQRIHYVWQFNGTIALLLGLYCLTLPRTPPVRNEGEKLAIVKAFRLFTYSSFTVLVVLTIVNAVQDNFMWIQTGPFLVDLGISPKDLGPAMSVCQIAEMFFLVVLGLTMKRIGIKGVMFLGGISYDLRFFIFSMHEHLPTGVIIASQVLHGLGAAAFYVTAFLYIDLISPKDIRNTAQTFFGMILFGVGGFVSGGLLPFFVNWATPAGGQIDWGKFWFSLAGAGLVMSIIFLLLFKDQSKLVKKTYEIKSLTRTLTKEDTHHSRNHE